MALSVFRRTLACKPDVIRAVPLSSVSAMQPRFMSVDASAVTYERHGDPSAVLSASKKSMSDPSGDSVLVRMLAASVSPTDFGQVRGFGDAPPLPAVAGNEGVGVVEKAGPSVKGLAPGDVVVPARAGVGTWATHAVASEASLFKLSGSADSLPIEQFAAFAAPCAAIRLVDGFASLSKGDVIVQNNAGSTVGQAVIQYAASKGIKTINIMRHRDNWEDMVNHLQGCGADLVVTDTFANTPEFAALISDMPSAKAGFVSAGGASASAVARALGAEGTAVVYGNVDGEPMHLPLDAVIGRGVRFEGFNLDHYVANATADERKALFSAASDLIASGKIKMLLATESFSDASDAIARAQVAGERKVVMKM